MNVLVDCVGHTDLYYSMHSLFGERLGMNVYSPDGGGEWKNFGVTATPLNNVFERSGPEWKENGITYVPMRMERTPDRGLWNQKLITFDKFKELSFDLIVCSSYANERAFFELGKLKPNVKLIRLIQNMGESPRYIKNALTVLLSPMSSIYNRISYWPEHYSGYSYTPPTKHNHIEAFIAIQPGTDTHDLWTRVKRALPTHEFHDSYEKPLQGVPHPDMPQAIRDIAFNWGVKPHGGGGLVLHQALSSGRPSIVKSSYCVRYFAPAEKIIHHGVNCIDFDSASFNECIELIRKWSEPAEHIKRCEIVANKFKEEVNFETEALKVEKWISEIKDNALPVVEPRTPHEQRVTQMFKEEINRMPFSHELELCVNQAMVDDREEVIRAHIRSLGKVKY